MVNERGRLEGCTKEDSPPCSSGTSLSQVQIKAEPEGEHPKIETGTPSENCSSTNTSSIDMNGPHENELVPVVCLKEGHLSLRPSDYCSSVNNCDVVQINPRVQLKKELTNEDCLKLSERCQKKDTDSEESGSDSDHAPVQDLESSGSSDDETLGMKHDAWTQYEPPEDDGTWPENWRYRALCKSEVDLFFSEQNIHYVADINVRKDEEGALLHDSQGGVQKLASSIATQAFSGESVICGSSEPLVDRKARQLLGINMDVYQCNHCHENFRTSTKHLRHLWAVHNEWQHRCKICGKVFYSEGFLKAHEKVHSTNTPFACSQCHKSFRIRSELRAHEKGHKKKRDEILKYSCEHCDFKYSSLRALTSHTFTVHFDALHSMMVKDGEGTRPFKCSVCGLSYSKITYLKEHINIHTGYKNFTCDVCGDSFPTGLSLQKHAKVHNGIYECEFCSASYMTELRLKRHVGKKHTDVWFKCYECCKCFINPPDLDEHKKTHTEEVPFSCDTCGMHFGFARSFFRHLRTHDERPFKCELCPSAFSKGSQLETHFRGHTDDKPFSCDQCGMRFKRYNILSDHLMTHSGEKYKCEDCGKTFARSRNVLIHRNYGRCPARREAKVIFACSDCGVRCQTETELTEHRAKHYSKEAKVFPCKDCGKVFLRKTALKIHSGSRRCAGVKNLKVDNACPECGIVFRFRAHLEEHMVKHTGERAFQCSQCGKCFARARNVKMHIKRGSCPFAVLQKRVTTGRCDQDSESGDVLQDASEDEAMSSQE